MCECEGYINVCTQTQWLHLLSPTVLLVIVLGMPASVSRSTDYGITFQNESHKWPNGAKANWYYISQDDDRYVSSTTWCSVEFYTHWCTVSIEEYR